MDTCVIHWFIIGALVVSYFVHPHLNNRAVPDIACVFVSRLLMLTFWCNSYVELQPRGADFNFPGYGVIGAQMLQVVIFADFMYHYVQSIRTNTRLVLPQAIDL